MAYISTYRTPSTLPVKRNLLTYLDGALVFSLYIGVVAQVAGLVAVAGSLPCSKASEPDKIHMKRTFALIAYVVKLASFGWLDWWLWPVFFPVQKHPNLIKYI